MKDKSLILTFIFGIMVTTSFAQEKDITQYINLAKKGDANAQNELGKCYYNGEGVAQDYKKAARWYKKASRNGNIEAMINIGDLYGDLYGDYNTAKYKPRTAYKYYKKAIDLGSSKAMIKMGDLHSYYYYENYSLHSLQDAYNSKAVEWYKLAIEQGNPDGLCALANYYDMIHTIYEIPSENNPMFQYADSLWLYAANSGSARAQAVMGFKNFLEKNFDEAMEWYEKAKENGADGVYHTINDYIPLDIAIMFCEHFKTHNEEYDFFGCDGLIRCKYGSLYGWFIEVCPEDCSSLPYSRHVEGDYVYAVITKDDKFGLIKFTNDGQFLETTPIIYDYGFTYYEDDKTGTFYTTLNGHYINFNF